MTVNQIVLLLDIYRAAEIKETDHPGTFRTDCLELVKLGMIDYSGAIGSPVITRKGAILVEEIKLHVLKNM